jgi:hypothetical protein
MTKTAPAGSLDDLFFGETVLIAEIYRDWHSASEDTSLERRILLAKPLVAPVRDLAEKLVTSQVQV